MAGKGRASVNDMKRVEVLVLMEIDQQTEDNGGPYGFSRKTLAERVGVSPYRARAAIDRLDSEGMIDVVSRCWRPRRSACKWHLPHRTW